MKGERQLKFVHDQNVYNISMVIFQNHDEFKGMKALITFLQFIPMEDEILDFFTCRCFLPSFGSYGQAVSKEKMF
jgi:hypothetical protein